MFLLYGLLDEVQCLFGRVAHFFHGRQENTNLLHSQFLSFLRDAVALVGDEAAGGSLRIQQPIPFQLCQSALHGIGIDAGLCRHLPHRGKAAAASVPEAIAAVIVSISCT